MKHWLFLLFLTTVFAAPVCGAPQSARETHRIRIGNRKAGAIEVSLDGGQNWATIGRVTRPATDTSAGGAALAAAAPGAVAAVALDGITLRTDRPPATGAGKPRIIRLLPNGAAAGTAGIGTDLARGQAIFGSLAPPLGSEVLLETATGSTRPLPGGYIPQASDHLVLVARVAVSAPAMVLFENRQGGRVLSVSPSGDETVAGHVLRPLRGVGRYPATEGAACGGVVLHDPTTVMVATTPAGAGKPGGFLIEAASAFRRSGVRAFRESDPNARTPERLNALGPEDGSVLVVDRLTTSGPAFSVPIALSPLGGSLAGETRVEARLDGGPWEPLPAVGGAAPDALTAEVLSKQFATLGAPRSLSEGVTHLRLVLALPSPERLHAALAQAVVETGARLAAATTPPSVVPQVTHSAAAKTTSKQPGPPLRTGSRPNPHRVPAKRVVVSSATDRGFNPGAAKQARKATKTLRVVANIQGRGIVYVMFYVDGQIRKMTNTPPFDWLWDTRGTPNGTHSLEIRGADADGRILTTQTQQVVVYN